MATARHFGTKWFWIINIMQGTVSGPPPQLYQPEFQKQLIEQQKQQQQLLEQQKQQQLLEQKQLQETLEKQKIEQQKQQIRELEQKQLLEQQHLLEKQKLEKMLLEQQAQQHMQQQQQQAQQHIPQQQQQQAQQTHIQHQPQQVIQQQQIQQQQVIPQQQIQQQQPVQQQQIQQQQQIISSQAQQQPVYYQQRSDNTNVIYQQQPSDQQKLPETQNVIYQQQPVVIQNQQQQTVLQQQPSAVIQQQQPVVVQQQNPAVIQHQQQQPNLVYHQQVIDHSRYQQPQVVDQQQNVVYQSQQPQGDQQTTTVIYKPTSMDKSQIIYNAKDVPSQQQPNVQYVPVVVPLENQQQPLHQVEPVPVQIQAAAVPLVQSQVVPQEVAPMQPPQVESVPGPGVTELAPTSVVLASSSDQEAPAPVTVDTRDKVSVLSQFGHSPIVCQTHPHPILKLDVSKRQAQTDTDGVSGWYTAPIIVTQDLDRAGHVSRRGSLPISQLSGSLLAPARASNGLSNGLGSGMKAHSAESSPKRVSVSQYSSIAHKLPFPSQSLRRRSADPSELLGYRTNPGSQRTSPTGSSLASEDLGLLSLLALDQRRASGGSCLPLSPVWESGPGLARQYNMMTIREVMSLCGSTTSLASTQVTVQQCTTRLICLSPLLSALVSLHQTIQKLFSDIPNTFLWRRLQLGLLVIKLLFYVQTSQFSYSLASL